MLPKLLTYMKYEEQLLAELIQLAEKQQYALSHYQISMLTEITKYQEEISKNLRIAEEQRINLLQSWFGLPRRAAAQLTLSKIEEKLDSEDLAELKALKSKLRNLSNKLKEINLTNRVLTNRAKKSTEEFLNILTNGTNYVYNVKV